MTDILYTIATIVFTLGIILLLVLLYFYTPSDVSVSNISSLPPDTYFSSSATITKVRETDKVATISLASFCSVEGVYFKDSPENLSSAVGATVRVFGHISSPNITIIDSIQ